MLWRAYRGARRAMRAPQQSQQLGHALAALVHAGSTYDAVALGLRLARAFTLAQLRSEGARGRVQRGLATEAFHLARLAFRAALGLREAPADPTLHFGQVTELLDWDAFSDGSYRSGRAAAGVLLQHAGGVLAEISLSLPSTCALEAELAAALTALETLRALGAQRVCLHVDSLGVFRAFEQRLPLKYCVQEAQLQSLVREFAALTIVLVPRLHNHAADRLAAEPGELQKC